MHIILHSIFYWWQKLSTKKKGWEENYKSLNGINNSILCMNRRKHSTKLILVNVNKTAIAHFSLFSCITFGPQRLPILIYHICENMKKDSKIMIIKLMAKLDLENHHPCDCTEIESIQMNRAIWFDHFWSVYCAVNVIFSQYWKTNFPFHLHDTHLTKLCVVFNVSDFIFSLSE